MSRLSMIGILLAIGIGWGATQPLGKIASAGGAAPLGLVFWQLVICTIVLGSITLVRGKSLPTTRPSVAFFVTVAILGTILPGLTFYISIARLPASIMSILISTVPLIAFPMGVLLGNETFSRGRLFGLVLGMIGVLIIALPKTSLPDPGMAAFLPLAMLGPLFYALEGTYVARSNMAGMDAVQAMFGASLFGVIIVAPVMLALGQGFWLDRLDTPQLALIGMSALHALLYAGFVWLAAKAGAVFATQTGYIVTVAGLVWAVVLLGERFSPLVLIAALVMLTGVAFVTPRAKTAGPA